MQSAAPKKSSFKCPTFAVPSKTESLNAQAERQVDSKKTENVEAHSPTPAGDNVPNVAETEKPSAATTATSEISLDINRNEGSKQKKNVEKFKKKTKKPKFEVKSGIQSPTNSSLKKVKDRKNEEKKKKPKKPNSEVKTDSESQKISKKKKTIKRELEKKEDKIAASQVKKDSAEPEARESQPVDAADKVDALGLADKINVQTSPEEEKLLEVKVDRKGQSSKKMPVRSLTDEEYENLFTAAVESAMNLDLDKWEPRNTSPVKVREPVKKKYSITVGKKPTPSSVNHDEEQKQEAKLEVDDHSHGIDQTLGKEVKVEKADIIIEPDDTVDDDEQVEVNEGLDEDVSEDEEQAEAVEEQQDAEEIVNNVQQENETTPVPSEQALSDCASPPPKKKKLHIVKKKAQLEPKTLPFSDINETSMIDKIKQLKTLKKELRQEKHEILKKKKVVGKIKEAKKKTDIVKKDKNSSSKLKQKGKSKKRQMLDRELENDGTWVQCCNSTCMKWRHLSDISDPSQLPERWTCNMNTCEQYNSCDKEEEKYDESHHIYTKFTEGSVVWAKMTGFPWWPAMVEQDPDTETYFSTDYAESMIPTHYHVVFFDERVSRTWVKAANIKAYTGHEDADGVVLIKMSKKGSHDYNKDIGIAKKNANRALSCNLKTRIELFGFATRYRGPWGKILPEKSPVTKDAHKHAKSKKKRIHDPSPVELLDDSTMDDVIGNAEAILDNVEEMLESLDDSDMDSDFEPEELVVVEKKKRKRIKEKVDPECKKRKKLTLGSSDSESENCDRQEDFLALALEDQSNTCETEKETSEKDVTGVVKFDSDVFTMEMDASCDGDADKETPEPPTKVKDQEKNEGKDNGKTEQKSHVKSGNKKPNCENKSSKEADINSIKCEDPADSLVLDGKDSENENKSSTGSDETKESVEHGSDSDNELSDNEIICKNNSMNECKTTLNSDRDHTEDSDSDDDFDLCGETDGEVPQANEGTETVLRQTFSMEDESDNDFDLEERFMYDTVVDGSQKSQERDIPVAPVPVALYSEDGSNPFDIMEE